MVRGKRAANPAKFSMAKTSKTARGPYKTQNDVKDPDQLGAGGIRVRQHRLAKGWTVEVLAEKARVSVGTISGIENGGGYSHVTLVKIARALGTTVGALFDVDPRDGGGSEFWPLWQRADASEKQRITDYSKGVVGNDRKPGK